jgi:hypothetical protein
MLPLNVALPDTLRSPVITTAVDEITMTFDVPATEVAILPPELTTLTLDVPLEMFDATPTSL